MKRKLKAAQLPVDLIAEAERIFGFAGSLNWSNFIETLIKGEIAKAKARAKKRETAPK